MSWTGAARIAAVIALAGACAGAPAMDAMARSKRPPVEAAPPPPPPAPAGPVGLPAQTLEDAAAFQALLERAVGTSPAFTDSGQVAQALKDDTAYRPRYLIRDAIAYAAVAALDDPTFVASVRAAGDSPDNRRLMVGYLTADPAYALLFKGSDGAAGLARAAFASGGLKLYEAGKAVRQESYDMQHQDWSKVDVLDRPDRLAAVEQAGRNDPPPPAEDHVAALRAAAQGATPLPISADALPPPYTPLVARALQLAAIAALGEATDDRYDQLAALGADDSTDRCLHMAKLNLFQCLAVARPNYEDVYCIGQHAMEDPGTCLVTNAGAAMPVEPVPVATPAPAHKTLTARRRSHTAS